MNISKLRKRTQFNMDSFQSTNRWRSDNRSDALSEEDGNSENSQGKKKYRPFTQKVYIIMMHSI